jgi:hypothetical protein
MNTRDFISSVTLALALSSGVLYGACNKPDAVAKENESIRPRPKYGSRFEAAMRELLPRLGFKVRAIEDERRQPPVPEPGRDGTEGPVPAIR